MQGSQVQNKKHHWKHKKKFLKKLIRNQLSCLTLDLDLISKDVTLSRFWKKYCQELQSELFLPHQTASAGQGCRSSLKSSNFMVEKLYFWKTTINQKISTPQHLSVSLPVSATPKAEKETLIVTRKVRLFPENENEMFDLLSLHRRAYNLAIEHFKNVPYEDQLKLVELRRNIKAQVKSEWEEKNYRAEVAGEAVRVAFKTRNSIISKRNKGVKCDYKFKSIKETKQYFTEQKLTRKFIDNFYVTETIPEDSFGRTTIISLEHGRWFVCAICEIELSASAEIQGLRVVSIDPGVRTFATTFDGHKSIKYGDGFYGDKVFPLLLKVDKLFSQRQQYINDTRHKFNQSFYDTIRCFAKRINSLRNRISDLISDLHRRVAFDLVSNNDVILLPKFETKDMVNKHERKIHTKTVRSMLGLAHYKFKMHLEWMCKKYGKHLVEVNEAWTSKTMSWCGKVKENLGGSKTISDGIISMDRDINGARNIFLRALSVA